MTDNTDTGPKRTGRPPIGDKPMTPAERAAASKARKREQTQQRKLAAEAAADDAIHGRSELIQQTGHVALLDALAAAINGLEKLDTAQAHAKHIKVTTAMLAELARRYHLSITVDQKDAHHADR